MNVKGLRRSIERKIMQVCQELMTEQYANIARKFKVNPYNCDNPKHYEKYIAQDCFTDYFQGMGVTHVFIDKNHETGESTIAGYITLRASSLMMLKLKF